MRGKPHIFKRGDTWYCRGFVRWAAGSSPVHAYNNWHAKVYA